MANVVRRPAQTPNRNLGISPTQAQKLLYISNKLGIDLTGMQGSSVNLVDTALLPTNATARQTLTFFSNANGKSRNFSNFQNGTLGAGEAMIIERVDFYAVVLSGTNLTVDTTTILDIIPLSRLSAAEASLTLPGGLKSGLMNITIANSKVVKDYQIHETDPSYNPQSTGVAMTSFATATASTIMENGYNGIILESPPVLPPNQKFQLTLEIAPIGTAASNLAIVCVVGRFGSIFSAGTTL